MCSVQHGHLLDKLQGGYLFHGDKGGVSGMVCSVCGVRVDARES